METKKSYYAVIPATVRYDKKVTPNGKLLYGEITALCNERGFCWATNQYFADLYEVDARTIRRWVQSLIAGGYIHVEIINETDRKIYLNDLGQKEPTPRTEMSGEVGQKRPHNTTVNTTVNNNISKAKKPKKEIVEEPLPDWLHKPSWESWVQHRKELKKKLTPLTIKRQIKFLSERKAVHVKIINQAIEKGWMSLYDLKDEKTQQNQGFSRGSGPSEDAIRFMEKKKAEENEKKEREEAIKNNDRLRELDTMMKGLANAKKIA